MSTVQSVEELNEQIANLDCAAVANTLNKYPAVVRSRYAKKLILTIKSLEKADEKKAVKAREKAEAELERRIHGGDGGDDEESTFSSVSSTKKRRASTGAAAAASAIDSGAAAAAAAEPAKDWHSYWKSYAPADLSRKTLNESREHWERQTSNAFKALSDARHRLRDTKDALDNDDGPSPQKAAAVERAVKVFKFAQDSYNDTAKYARSHQAELELMMAAKEKAEAAGLSAAEVFDAVEEAAGVDLTSDAEEPSEAVAKPSLQEALDALNEARHRLQAAEAVEAAAMAAAAQPLLSPEQVEAKAWALMEGGQ